MDVPAPLSGVLRARTAAAHVEAERSPFLTALVEGRITTAGLAALLSRLLPVYDALERAELRWVDDPRVGRFVRPELRRGGRLRADLQHLTGHAAAAVTPASTAYAARIDQVAPDPAGFVAHHYTRCLGDLSGGQLIGAALERSLALVDGRGASSFAFLGSGPDVLRQQYRDRLDQAPFTSSEREELVGEALTAYRLNVAVSAELDADLDRWTSAAAVGGRLRR